MLLQLLILFFLLRLLLLILFNFALEVVHVDLHLVLQPDMPPDVSLKLLNNLLVNCRWTAVFRRFLGVLGCLLVLNHVQQRILHALLDQILRLDRQSIYRGFEIGASLGGRGPLALTQQILVTFIPFKIFDLEIHDDFDAASDVLEHLEAIRALQQLLLLIIQVSIVDVV